MENRDYVMIVVAAATLFTVDRVGAKLAARPNKEIVRIDETSAQKLSSLQAVYRIKRASASRLPKAEERKAALEAADTWFQSRLDTI
jgi:hypothetical protein